MSFKILGDYNQAWVERPQTRQGGAPWSHPPPTNGPADIKAVLPPQNAAVARRLPVPSLATICVARTAFSSRLECPVPTGSHQGSGKQHLGASLACQIHSRPKLSPGKQTSRRPARTWKALLSSLANLSSGAVPPARSEEPAALLSRQQASRLSPVPPAARAAGTKPVKAQGQWLHPFHGSSLRSRMTRGARACERCFYTGRRAS